MIDPKKMTEKTQEALIAAQQAAQEAGHAQLDVEHLLAALLQQQGGIVPSVVEALGGSPQQLLAAIQQELTRQPKVSGNVQLSASGRLGRVLQSAQKEAEGLGDEYVSTEHLFLAMTQDQGYTGQALQRIGATRERVLGPQHAQIANSLNNLGMVLRDEGDLSSAVKLLEKAVVTIESACGENHPHTATCLSNLGLLKSELGELVEAEDDRVVEGGRAFQV